MTFSGGPIFWTLLVLALAALFVFFERLLELRRAQIDWQDFVKGVINVLESGNEKEALAICEDTPAPVASVVATAIRHRAGSFRTLRDAVDAQGRAEIARLDRRLASLAIIGQIAPLLGLLGAIFGLMQTLNLANEVELVTRANLLTASSTALMDGALGLMVAIPVAVMYGSLRVRMDRFVSELEAAATLIVGYLSPKEADA